MSTLESKIPKPKSKTTFWLIIISLTILSVFLTIFTIKFNLQKINQAGNKDNLFSTIHQYFVKQFSKPTFIPPATKGSLDYLTTTND